MEADLIKRRDEWTQARIKVKVMEAKQREAMMMNKYKVCTAEELAHQFNIVLSVDNRTMLHTKTDEVKKKEAELR